MYVVARLNGQGRELALAVRRILLAYAECYAVDILAGVMPPIPPLYQTGIKFKPEPAAGTGIEDWADPWTVLARGYGDCDDLVLYRLTELLVELEKATTAVAHHGNAFHVGVRRQDQRLEDPSLILIERNGRI